MTGEFTSEPLAFRPPEQWSVMLWTSGALGEGLLCDPVFGDTVVSAKDMPPFLEPFCRSDIDIIAEVAAQQSLEVGVVWDLPPSYEVDYSAEEMQKFIYQIRPDMYADHRWQSEDTPQAYKDAIGQALSAVTQGADPLYLCYQHICGKELTEITQHFWDENAKLAQLEEQGELSPSEFVDRLVVGSLLFSTYDWLCLASLGEELGRRRAAGLLPTDRPVRLLIHGSYLHVGLADKFAYIFNANRRTRRSRVAAAPEVPADMRSLRVAGLFGIVQYGEITQ